MAVADAPAAQPIANVAEAEETTPFKLFIGQVPMSMTAEQLKPNFEPFGNIEEVTIIYDKSTQMSKGCGFVTYSTEDSARAAIDALSEKCILNGKPLVVKFAEGLRQRMEHRLFVGNLPPEIDEETITRLFGEHGDVKQLQLARQPAGPDGVPSATAYVRFSKRAEAAAAIAALHGHLGLPGASRPLVVKFAERATDSPPPNGTGNGSPAGARPAGPGGSMPAAAGMPMGGAPPPYSQMGGPMPVGPPPGAAMGGAAYAGGGGPAGGSHAAASGAPAGGAKLFVGMIPYATGEGELHQLFAQFGPLMEVFMMREKDGRSKGCAFVRYYSREAAHAACLNLNGTLALPGAARHLVVKYADAADPRNHRSPQGAGGAGGGAHGGAMGGGAHMGGQPMAPGGGPHGYVQHAGVEGMSYVAMPPGGTHRLMGGHHAPSSAPQMIPAGASMVPMALMPAQMGLVHAPMAMQMMHPQMAVDGQMMMHPSQMAAGHYGGGMIAAPAAPPVNQYGVPAGYPSQPPPGAQMIDPQQAGGAGGQPANNGWGSPTGDGSGQSGYTTLAEQPAALGVAEYSHAGHRGDLGGFGAMGMPAHMGAFGGMGMIERQMSSTTLSSNSPSEESPPGASWDRLYVSNLPRQFGEAEVTRLFAQFGTLAEVTPHKRGDGTSKGCFFVSFASTIEGQQAARALHNYMLPGNQRPMTVRPSTSRRREARMSGNAHGGQHSPEAAPTGMSPGSFSPGPAAGAPMRSPLAPGYADKPGVGAVDVGDGATAQGA